MKKNTSNGFIFFSIPILFGLLLLGFSSVSFGAAMTDYCQVPPFIGTGGSPNILMVNDVSGSMSWSAYGTSDSSTAPPDAGYDSSTTYEGYFDPAKSYKLVSGVYQKKTPTGGACIQQCATPNGSPNTSCVKNNTFCTNGTKYGGGLAQFGCSSSGSKPFGCCLKTVSSGDCGVLSGNYLNYKNMHRIDLTRWAMTGGKPASCTGGTFNNNYCDPELWNQTGNSTKVGAVCNNSLVNADGTTFGGCILLTDNGTEVAVPWSRVNDGLAYQFMTLLVQPKLGVMTFSGSRVNSGKVYIGDFIASNNNSASFPYSNTITNLNAQDPGGGTPTGPALWDAFNYFAQSAPQYGGFAVQSGSGDRWKNPLYVCDGKGGTNCQQSTCTRNFVLLMSDGEWNTPHQTIGTSTTCSVSSTANESSDPVVPAYCMHKGFTNLATSPTVSTKVGGVYTIGLFMQPGSAGVQAMGNTAMYGSFENSALTWPSNLTGFPPNTPTCTDSDGTVSGSLCAAFPPSSPDWDANGDGVPDTFVSAGNASDIKQAIMDAVQSILAKATSGTAASVLASGEGKGANLVQATYYPSRKFFSASIPWVGGLQNLWYFVDPTFNNSSIREDDGDYIEDLDTSGSSKDYITQLYFDIGEQKAKARLYNSSGAGVPGTLVKTVDFEDIASLWEAGTLLWDRDPADRTIYTPVDTSQLLTANANKFSASSPNNVAALRPLLNTDASAVSSENNQLAANIINWVRGTDIADYLYSSGTVTESYRPRTVQIDLNADGNVTDTSVTVSGVTMDETVTTNVWKLGDIIDSTPKIASWVQLNGYDGKWSDSTYKDFYTSATYTSRGMVYVGANDGMLHAFKLGLLQYLHDTNHSSQIATLTGANKGKEMWAFIPKNVLPYLKYLKDPDYCHLHTVDLTPFLVDASIGVPTGCTGDYWTCQRGVTTWRTILIGGMRFGGACRNAGATCNSDGNTADCVNTPVSGLGYSSYFALDVTDENNPQLLWEFTDPGLGFSTSGPAIVRINNRTVAAGDTKSSLDTSANNGRWFVVFGSGPTGPIDTASQKFLGRSDQNLKLFVLDLKTGVPARTIDTGVPFAFAGSMIGSVFDNNPFASNDYQDRAVYIPYVKRTGTSGNYTWTDGGVLRLLTNQDLAGTNVSGGTGGTTALNPGNWAFSTVMDGIGPVTSAVVHLLNPYADSTCSGGGTGKLRLYFGTGRYYYRTTAGLTDDASSQRNLFGIVEPCFDNNAYLPGCLDGTGPLTRTKAALSDATSGAVCDPEGWFINLDLAGSFTYDENNNGTTTDDVARNYSAERVITDPTTAPAMNATFFTTYKPYDDICAIGGKTFIWAVQYDTGGAATSLYGTALIQVSTGVIEQLNLKTIFSDKGGRRSGAMEGVPPTAQGLSLMVPPLPVQKVLHKRER